MELEFRHVSGLAAVVTEDELVVVLGFLGGLLTVDAVHRGLGASDTHGLDHDLARVALLVGVDSYVTLELCVDILIIVARVELVSVAFHVDLFHSDAELDVALLADPLDLSLDLLVAFLRTGCILAFLADNRLRRPRLRCLFELGLAELVR